MENSTSGEGVGRPPRPPPCYGTDVVQCNSYMLKVVQREHNSKNAYTQLWSPKAVLRTHGYPDIGYSSTVQWSLGYPVSTGPGHSRIVSLARPSRKERGSGQTAIVELWKSKFHCPTFRRTLKWVLSKLTASARFAHTLCPDERLERVCWHALSTQNPLSMAWSYVSLCNRSHSSSTTLLKQFDQTLSPCVRVWLARLIAGYLKQPDMRSSIITTVFCYYITK